MNVSTLAIAKSAERQLASMPERYHARVSKLVADPALRYKGQPAMRFSKVIGPAPGGGDLVRFAAGSLRILVTVEAGDGLIVGFGVRES